MFLERDEFLSKKSAAITIQKSVRAFCTYNLPARQAAAKRIQRVWRTHLVKLVPGRVQFSGFVEQRIAAKTIQTVFRRYVKHWRYLRILVATVRIQAMGRAWLCRRRWKIQLEAAIKLERSLFMIV